jgi:ABC-type lipoprotein export system ATPase subunit
MALIQAKNVTKNYFMGDQEVPALRGISFEIGEGAFAAFVGSSGSGRSTLLNLIGCLDHPSGGTLLVHGTDISTLSRSAAATFRGEHLGFVFQDFNLVPVLSVYENIEYQMTSEISYVGFANWELRARLILLSGRAHTEFNEKTASQRLEIYARWFFLGLSS